MNPLFQIPENLAELALEALQSFVDETLARLREVAADPSSFAVDGRSDEDVLSESRLAVEAIREARAAIARLEAEETPEDAPAEPTESAEGTEDAPVEDAPAETAAAAEAFAAEVEALAAEVEAVPEPAATPSRTAAAAPPARRRPPARSVRSRPAEEEAQVRSLVAAAGVDGYREGAEMDPLTIAQAMIDKRRRFGNVAEGSEEDVAIARVSWADMYPSDRRLSMDEEANLQLVAAAVDQRVIRANFEARRSAAGGSLTASGGLCAPVTPYYNLQMVSVAERPVRAALPAFNADRGGLRYANPATLAAITTGVGQMTAAQDAAGGTLGTKSCQTVDCPPFQETDVEILYHCLRFGNLGARTFPERVAQWNNLVLAAHARLAERMLLTNIDAASTQVEAHSIAAGAAAELLAHVLVAAAGMRSRHRMDPEAVLRLLMPRWVLDLVVSDVYRSQFQRWDMTADRFVALLRQGNVEPSFYIDSAAGKDQEFGLQSATDLCSTAPGAGHRLLSYPATVTWYLFPEGSFLYVDGGVLELGLVRDSVLNSTNDYEIFGESFENVAFIGVESLAVTSTVADTGVTAGTSIPQSGITTPIDYCDPFYMKD